MLVGVCGKFFSNLQWLTFVWARIKNPTAYCLFFQAEGKDWSSSRLCFIWNALKLLWLKFVGVWWQFVSILQWLLWAGLKKPQALSLLALGITEEKACAVHDCPKFELHKATFVKIGWHLQWWQLFCYGWWLIKFVGAHRVVPTPPPIASRNSFEIEHP